MSLKKTDLKFGTNKKEYTKLDHYENNYKYWRNYRMDVNEGFIMVPKNIMYYLGSIRSKAVNLYLYYCYRANTETGKSWAAIDTMARELETSTKSITNWNNELESLGLIKRVAGNKSSKTTYLLPISDYYYFEKNLSLKDFLKISNLEIDGELISIFHLYQWRKNHENKKYEIPYHVIALNFKRTYTLDETKANAEPFEVNKTVLFEIEEDKILNKTSSDINQKSPLYKFDSQIFKDLDEQTYKKYENITNFREIPKVGIAVTAGINLQAGDPKENIDYFKELIQGVQNKEHNNLPIAELLENNSK